MKKLLFFLFLIVKIIYAQDETPDYLKNIANFTPVTPNASSFLVYGNTPVNHATGIPQINIPLFTIEEDGVSIPISLSYHASGVKVDDLASVVGLKWTLNAGGGIFRQVNDKPDESGWLNASARDYITADWTIIHSIDDEQIQRNMENSNNTYDYYPDDFSYSFLGNSGSFILDRNGIPYYELEDVLEIERVASGFKSRDKFGNNYYFGSATEWNAKAVVAGVGSNLNFNRSTETTGWMIDQIITKNSKHIDFTYQPYEFQYQLNNVAQSISHAQKCKSMTVVQPMGSDITQVSGPCGCEGITTVLSVPTYNIKESTTTVINTPTNQLIRTIETTNIRATFNYVVDPNLSTWKSKLVSIVILDKITNKNKSFNFGYDTFGGDPRLRLKSIQEIGFDGSAKQPYQFEYVSGDLPNKGSLSRDFHGFYNGKSNRSLIPFSLDAYSLFPPSYQRKLGDRRESIQHLKTGILKRITYPTGGSTSFDYEPNTVPDTIGVNPVIKSAPPILLTPHANDETSPEGAFTSFRTRFSLTKDLFTKGTPVNYSSHSEVCDFNADEASIDCSRFNIYKVNTDGSLGTAIFTPFQVVGPDGGSKYLLKGDYVLELSVKNEILNANPGVRIEIHLNWLEEENGSDLSTLYAGGLRVKSIKDRDANETLIRQTNYSYDKLVGYSMNLDHMKKYYGIKTVFSSDNIGLNQRSRRSGYYYEEVSIETVGDGSTLKTKEMYKANVLNKSYSPIMVRKEVYNQNDLVKSIDMTYDNTLEDMTQFYILADKTRCIERTGGWMGDQKPREYLGYDYPESMVYYHKKSLLTGRTEVDYYSKLGEPFEASIKISNYQYNEDMQIKKITSDGRYYVTNEQELVNKNYRFLPDGRYSEILYSFPQDHQNSNPTITTLQNKYLVGLPISKKIKVNNQLTQGQYLNYDTNGNVIGDYRYNKGQVANSSGIGHIPSNYELYETYNLVNGKPVEIKRKDGLPTAVLWDTTHTYVLAQLVGASKAELDSITGAIDLKITTDLQLQTLYNNLRIALPQAQITTFMHNPLKGVVQITDTNGYTISYDYDGLSRLIRTKDQDNFLLSEQKYHYMNQN